MRKRASLYVGICMKNKLLTVSDSTVFQNIQQTHAASVPNDSTLCSGYQLILEKIKFNLICHCFIFKVKKNVESLIQWYYYFILRSFTRQGWLDWIMDKWFFSLHDLLCMVSLIRNLRGKRPILVGFSNYKLWDCIYFHVLFFH